MISIAHVTDEDELENLKTVLSKTSQCDAIATLKQMLERNDGTFNQQEIENVVVSPAKNLIYINERDGLAYLTISSSDTPQLKKVGYLWETMIKRGDLNYQKGKLNDYVVTVDLIAAELEKERVYTLSFLNPIFRSDEDGSLQLVFKLSNIFYGIEHVTVDEIEYGLAEQKAYEDETSPYSDYNENSSFIETEGFTQI